MLKKAFSNSCALQLSRFGSFLRFYTWYQWTLIIGNIFQQKVSTASHKKSKSSSSSSSTSSSSFAFGHNSGIHKQIPKLLSLHSLASVNMLTWWWWLWRAWWLWRWWWWRAWWRWWWWCKWSSKLASVNMSPDLNGDHKEEFDEGFNGDDHE